MTSVRMDECWPDTSGGAGAVSGWLTASTIICIIINKLPIRFYLCTVFLVKVRLYRYYLLCCILLEDSEVPPVDINAQQLVWSLCIGSETENEGSYRAPGSWRVLCKYLWVIMGLAAGLVLEAAVVTWSHDWPGPASPHQPPATQPMAAEQQEQEGWWRVASWSRTLPPAAGARVVTGVARAGQGSVWRLVVARLPRWQTGGHERCGGLGLAVS